MELAGQRLDQALAALLPQHSRSRLKQWIETGHVHVDGRVLLPKTRLVGGERLDINAPSPDDLEDAPQAIALTVVHEDEALLVIDKPAGLTVHPGAGNRDGTLLNALLHHDAALAQLPRAGIVHRLDKDTSGLMVVARTETAHTHLVRQLQARTVKRDYLALAHGRFERDAFIVEAPIGRHPTHRTRMAVVSHGKPARTHVLLKKCFGFATLARCTLDTGRTHQIRVHLAALGHPLVGDPVYRSDAKKHLATANIPEALAHALRAFPRQALHASRLGLTHPVSQAPMEWASPLPEDFGALLALLEGRV